MKIVSNAGLTSKNKTILMQHLILINITTDKKTIIH
jgi:hypothetical protein